MKKIISTRWIVLTFALLVVGITIYAYDPFSPGNKRPLSLSSPSYEETGLFKINPEQILVALEKRDSNVFVTDPRPLDDRYDGPILYDKPIGWSQTDNLSIVRALNNYVWKDEIENWKLYRMIFNVDCENDLKGLPGGVFTYFRTIFHKGKIIDSWREVEIDPEYSVIAWGGGAEFPHPILGWKSIDLNRLKITAEDAIRIADENGGSEIRLKAQNQCSIHLILVSGNWKVTYNTSDNFEIFIDPYTGKVLK